MLTSTDARLLAAALVAQRGGRALFCVPDYPRAKLRFQRLEKLLLALEADGFAFSPTTHLVRCKRSRGVIQIQVVGRPGDEYKVRGLRFDNRFRDESYASASETARETVANALRF